MAKGGATRPLPWYQGPKLNPFVFPEGIVGPRIRFLGLVRGSAHSETHRVDIDGQEYDLTVVSYNNCELPCLFTNMVSSNFIDGQI